MRPASRSPAARLLRARVLGANWEQTRATHCYEDQSVLAYAKFLYELDTLDGQQHDQYLALRPVLAELHYLLSSGSQLSGPRLPTVLGRNAEPQADDQSSYKDRAVIRALILGNADPAMIADTLDLQEPVIRLYEHLAFDVRHRLAKRGWLHNFVFGDSVLDTTYVQDFERVCMITVYKHGIEGLNRLLYLGSEASEQYVEGMRKQIRSDMAAKASLSLLTMPMNSHTIPELVSGYNQWEKSEREIEARNGKNEGSADDELKDGLIEAMKTAAFTVCDDPLDSEVSAEESQGDRAFLLALQEALREVNLAEQEKASV